jgi:hypothetical protein
MKMKHMTEETVNIFVLTIESPSEMLQMFKADDDESAMSKGNIFKWHKCQRRRTRCE